jgi:predicted aspartyl protease
MPLWYTDGSPFAIGAAPYTYCPATDRESTLRIFVTVDLGGVVTSAFVDTGGIYLWCPPQLAIELGLDLDEGEPVGPILSARGRFEGILLRIPLTLVAEEGNSLVIEPTVFVPSLKPGDHLPEDFPCILGMQGCLERLRFAVDPSTDTFHFGGLAPADC